MNEITNNIETRFPVLVGSYQELKTAYLQDFSLRHLASFKALGYLGETLGIKHREWRNSSEHAMAAGAHAELLATALGLPDNEVSSIASAAILHEIDKREEARILNEVANPIEALEAIEHRADAFHQQLIDRSISEDVIRLSRANVPTSPAGPKTLAEKIIWYTDIMLSDTQPQLVEQRIAKFELGWVNRTQSFDPDRRERNLRLNEAFRTRLGGRSLTEVQRSIASSVEKELATLLDFEGNSAHLPFHLKQLLYEHILKWGTSRGYIEKAELPVTPEMAFGLKLVNSIKKAVLPVFGNRQLDALMGEISKDFQYAVDIAAENAIKSAFEELWKKGIWYGYTTEEQGLVLPPGHTAELIYQIDPVDGSRPAQAGMETACITMGIVRAEKSNPTMKDIVAGVTHAIKEDRTFLAQKGGGVYEVIDSALQMVTPREHAPQTLDEAFMAYENYGVRESFLGRIIDDLRGKTQSSSVYVAASFGLLSLVRGQNDLYLDVRARLLKECPRAALKLHPKCMQPYDIAAPWLMLKELGGVAMDAYGKSLDDRPLWVFNQDGSWSSEGDISLVAAVTPQLHAQAMKAISSGFSKLRTISSP